MSAGFQEEEEIDMATKKKNPFAKGKADKADMKQDAKMMKAAKGKKPC